MFEATVSQIFKASHAVRTVSGEFEPVHLHDWKVVVTVAGTHLDATGCIIDFAIVQRHLRACLSAWDGKNLNELGMFIDTPPSTEFLAKCLFDQLDSILKEEGVILKRVTIWETDHCSAAFTRD